jgi:hypothetical protein
MLNIYHPYGCHLKGRAIVQPASRYCPLAIRWRNARCSNLFLLIGCCSASGTYFQDQRTDTCLQILSLVGIDETLVNFIKQAPSKGGKGGQRERTQVPLGLSQKCTKPKWVTRDWQRERTQVRSKSAQIQRGSQGKDKERGLKSKPKAHKPKGGSLGGKGTNCVPDIAWRTEHFLAPMSTLNYLCGW